MSDDAQRIGAEVLAAREHLPPVPWKVLMARYQLGRTTLWTYALLASVRTKKPLSEHLESGGAES